jgi:signal transduction histidine kinase
MALISIELEQLGQSFPDADGQLRSCLEVILKQIVDASRDIHQISHALHPSKLTSLGLVAAVRGLCDDLRSSHELRIEFFHEGVSESAAGANQP